MTTTAVNDTVWEQHRDVIHSLYIEQNLSQQKVLEIISRPPYSLQATSSQFERILSVVLKISKNLTKPDWVAINYHTTKRKREDDKDTEVFVNGMIQNPKKLRRQARRYANRDLLPQGQVPQIPPNVSLRTPPRSPIQGTLRLVEQNQTATGGTSIYGLLGPQYITEPESISATGVDWSALEWQPQPDISDVLPFSPLMASPSRQPASNNPLGPLPVVGFDRYTVLLKKSPWFEFEDLMIPKLTKIFRPQSSSPHITSQSTETAVSQFPSVLKQVIGSATDSKIDIRNSILSLSQIIPERSPGDLQREFESIEVPALVNVYAAKVLFSLLSNNYQRLGERETAEAIVKWIKDIPLTVLEVVIQERGPTARAIVSRLLYLIVTYRELPTLKRCIAAGLSKTYLSGLQGGRMLLQAMEVWLSKKDLVLELLRWNPDITLENDNGDSAIHLATDRQWPEVLNVLLELGADLEVPDSNYKTPLARAIFPDDEYIQPDCKIVAWLLDHGADIEEVDYSAFERALIPPYEVCMFLWDRFPQKWVWLTSSCLVFDAVSGPKAFEERVHRLEKDVVKAQSVLEEALCFTMRVFSNLENHYAFIDHGRDLAYKHLSEKPLNDWEDDDELDRHMDEWNENETVKSDVLDTFLQHGVDPNVSSIQGAFPPLAFAIQSWGPEDVQQLLNYGAKLENVEVITSLFEDTNSSNKLAVLRHILLDRELPVHINQRLDNGRYPLQSVCCIHQGRLGNDIVKHLVERGAQVNSRTSRGDGYTALHFAVKHGRLDTVQYLIEKRAKIGNWINNNAVTLFELCAQKCSHHCRAKRSEEVQDRLAIFKLLLEKGAERNDATKPLESDFGSCLAAAIHWHRNSKIVDSMIQNRIALNASGYIGSINQSCTPLQEAVRIGLFEIAKRLIENGADVNASSFAQGHTALQWACKRWRSPADVKKVELLLTHGADVNAVSYDEEGTTALQAACHGYKSLHSDLIELLFDYGADVNGPPAKRSGRTALQFACLNEKIDFKLINLLLERGADVNAPAAYEKGVTALQAAVIQGSLELVFYLLEKGAKVDAPGATLEGRTALEAAAEHGRLDISQALLNAFEALGLQPDLEKPLRLARKEGHFGVVELLEKQKTR